MSQRRRGQVKTRRPKVIDAALGVTSIWAAIAIPFFVGGGFGRANPTFFLFLAALTILAWAWALRTIRIQQSADKSLEQLQSLSPDVFEDWVGARFRELGYKVKTTGAGGDHGVDLIAELGNDTAVIQCKNYKSWSVGEPVLRDLFGAMHHFGANQAYLVTSGRLTAAAREWVKGKPIEVWDGERLVQLSIQAAPRGKEIGNGSKIAVDSNQRVISADQGASTAPSMSATDSEALPRSLPICPRCGSNLVERRNRHTGETFLACPNYPACRHTQPLKVPGALS